MSEHNKDNEFFKIKALCHIKSREIFKQLENRVSVKDIAAKLSKANGSKNTHYMSRGLKAWFNSLGFKNYKEATLYITTFGMPKGNKPITVKDINRNIVKDNLINKQENSQVEVNKTAKKSISLFSKKHKNEKSDSEDNEKNDDFFEPKNRKVKTLQERLNEKLK